MAKSENKTDTKALEKENKVLEEKIKKLGKLLNQANCKLETIRTEARKMAEQAQAPVYRNAGECFTAMIDSVVDGKPFDTGDFERHSIKLKK